MGAKAIIADSKGSLFVVVEEEEEEEVISDELFEMLEENAPPVTMILKELLGINIFTYILAGLIAIMLTLNGLFGPGWLGQKLGMPGTGTFTEVSKSLPETYDLNQSDN